MPSRRLKKNDRIGEYERKAFANSANSSIASRQNRCAGIYSLYTCTDTLNKNKHALLEIR